VGKKVGQKGNSKRPKGQKVRVVGGGGKGNKSTVGDKGQIIRGDIVRRKGERARRK